MNNYQLINVIAILLFVHKSYSYIETNVLMSEVFVFQIEPSMFNWTTYQQVNNHDDNNNGEMIHENDYIYRASLINKPDLPEWIQYKYSKRYHCGYLYGVPSSISINNDNNNINDRKMIEQLQIIGLNRVSYETRLMHLNIHIIDKLYKAKYEIQLKIDNINIDDMFNNNRNKIDVLLNIFKLKLWRTAYNDLYLTFIDSTVNLGGRLPLHPYDDEGVILRFGSYQPFTNELLELHDEVKPLYKYKLGLSSCPRDFKRTTVDRLFRDLGYALDWCSFQLFYDEDIHNNIHGNASDTNTILKQNQQQLLLSNNININSFDDVDKWLQSIYKSQVPKRNYSNEFIYTIILPVIIMSICVWLLSFILCFQHEGITDNHFDYFIHSLFDICFYYYYSLQSSKRFNEQQQTTIRTTNNMLIKTSDDEQPNKYNNKTYNEDNADTINDKTILDADDNNIIIIKNIINNDSNIDLHKDIDNENDDDNYKTLTTLNQRKKIPYSYSSNPRCPSPPPYPGTNIRSNNIHTTTTTTTTTPPPTTTNTTHTTLYNNNNNNDNDNDNDNMKYVDRRLDVHFDDDDDDDF